MKLGLKKQLLGLIALIIMLMLMILGYNHIANNSLLAMYDELLKIDVHIYTTTLELEGAMLMARRAEKDFIMSMDDKHIKLHDTATTKLNEITEELYTLEVANKAANAEVLRDALHKSIKDYKELFHSVTDLYQKKGKKDKGIVGEFRTAVHEIEALFAAEKVLQLAHDLLMLRRHEKDYLLRLDNKYVEKVTKLLTAISDEVVNISKLISNITTGNKEQSIGLQSVTQAIVDIEKAAQQNASSAEQSSSVSEELQAQATQLMQTVNNLKLIVYGA